MKAAAVPIMLPYKVHQQDVEEVDQAPFSTPS